MLPGQSDSSSTGHQMLSQHHPGIQIRSDGTPHGYTTHVADYVPVPGGGMIVPSASGRPDRPWVPDFDSKFVPPQIIHDQETGEIIVWDTVTDRRETVPNERRAEVVAAQMLQDRQKQPEPQQPEPESPAPVASETLLPVSQPAQATPAAPGPGQTYTEVKLAWPRIGRHTYRVQQVLADFDRNLAVLIRDRHNPYQSELPDPDPSPEPFLLEVGDQQLPVEYFGWRYTVADRFDHLLMAISQGGHSYA